MAAPVVKTKETHRDDTFIYGKRYVDGEYICEWMQALPDTKIKNELTTEEKATASKIAKYLLNAFQAILNKHKIKWNRVDPQKIREVWDLHEAGIIDRKFRNEYAEYYVLYYDLLISTVENLTEKDMLEKWKRFNEFCRNSKVVKDKVIDIPTELISEDGDY